MCAVCPPLSQSKLFSLPPVGFPCISSPRYYGFDPHDDSDNLRIHNNVVWDNGECVFSEFPAKIPDVGRCLLIVLALVWIRGIYLCSRTHPDFRKGDGIKISPIWYRFDSALGRMSFVCGTLVAHRVGGFGGIIRSRARWGDLWHSDLEFRQKMSLKVSLTGDRFDPASGGMSFVWGTLVGYKIRGFMQSLTGGDGIMVSPIPIIIKTLCSIHA